MSFGSLIDAKFTLTFGDAGSDYVLVSAKLVMSPGESPAFEYAGLVDELTALGWMENLWSLLGLAGKVTKRAEVFMVSDTKAAVDLDGLAGIVDEVPAGDALDIIVKHLHEAAQRAA